MDKNEIRVFKISGEAINELVWELLNQTGEQFFDISANQEAIYRLNCDKDKDQLVFYALEYAKPHVVDFEKIDRYINEHIDKTTDSLFNAENKPYVSLSVKDIQ